MVNGIFQQDDRVEDRQVGSENNASEKLWRVEDVADYLRLSPDTVRSMAREGLIPSVKVGKRFWRFKSKEIEQWVEDQRSENHS